LMRAYMVLCVRILTDSINIERAFTIDLTVIILIIYT
jgi:hypothetical protein